MPIDRGSLNQQLDDLGGSARWWNERELRDLPAILQADEQVLAIARGKVGRVRVMRRTWLLVATDRRLVCVRSSRRAGWRQLELGAGQILRVALRIGPFRGRVLVQTSGDTFRLLLPRTDAYDLQRALSGLVHPVTQVGQRMSPRRVVRRVVDHILAFPAVALEPEPPRRAPAPVPPALPAPEVTERMEALEEETDELRRQVAFLEQLLRERQAARQPDALLQEPIAP